jgi:D-alanyl-lipoteichoic acid acyltransferase DltB (MBOAT superfamily)
MYFPVGISFYTFHGLSYVIDIYLKRIKAEYNFIDYSLFVSYFPLLVAGPIERATHLLPQVKVKRTFDFEKAKQGVYQIIWGLLKKVVIADTCASYANAIFDNYSSMNSLSLMLGAIYFAFQIYGDFSGYTDMALGMSKLFGIDLLKNFNYPYFSRDIAEFWRRWHISLSSWFKDYLTSHWRNKAQSQNRSAMYGHFVVSGFGTEVWNHLAWGFNNSLFFLPLLLLRNRNNIEASPLNWNLESLNTVFHILFTFLLSCMAWVFFRAKSITDATLYLKGMVTKGNFASQYLSNERYNYELLFLIFLFVVVEWNNRFKEEPISGKHSTIKMAFCLLAILALGTFSDYKEFIYFQF